MSRSKIGQNSSHRNSVAFSDESRNSKLKMQHLPSLSSLMIFWQTNPSKHEIKINDIHGNETFNVQCYNQTSNECINANQII